MNPTQADRAYSKIRRDILNCALEPGLQIAQPQLVERFGLGITPVREALKRLEQEGLVKAIPRFGYLITPITVEDIESIYELRLVLEKSAVRFAAQRATDEQLSEISKNARFTYRYQDPESYQTFLDSNVSFHTAVAMTSRNRRLAEAISKLLEEMNRIFYLGLELRDSADEMQGEHIELAEALLKRDAELIERIVGSQITRSKRRVLEMLDQRISVRSQTTIMKQK